MTWKWSAKFSTHLLVLCVLAAIPVSLTQECGSILRNKGTIVSEGFPNSYPSNFDCTWVIEARDYDTVQIRFENFYIEPGEKCEFDSLQITDNQGTNRYCGDKLSDVGRNGYLATKGKTTLLMTSDDSVQLKGITLRFEVRRGTPPTTTPPPPPTTTPAPTLHDKTCADQPCQNGADCVNVDAAGPGELKFVCFCTDGFEGDTCEIDIDDCASSPCENGGTCVDGANKWQCKCVDGYIGETCAIDYDECRQDPCLNGGTCIDKVNAFECVCTPGWTNWDCSTDIDECDSHPCKNYGACEDEVGSFTCVCHPKWTGPTCEIAIDDPTEPPPTDAPDSANPSAGKAPNKKSPVYRNQTTVADLTPTTLPPPKAKKPNDKSSPEAASPDDQGAAEKPEKDVVKKPKKGVADKPAGEDANNSTAETPTADNHTMTGNNTSEEDASDEEEDPAFLPIVASSAAVGATALISGIAIYLKKTLGAKHKITPSSTSDTQPLPASNPGW